MVIDRCGFNFSPGKFRPDSGDKVVDCLADYRYSGRRYDAKKEKRRWLLRLDEEKRGRKEVKNKIKNNPQSREVIFYLHLYFHSVNNFLLFLIIYFILAK